MEDLTYICTDKHENRAETTFVFKRTEWSIGTKADPDDDESWSFEDAHWSAEGAEPMEMDGTLTVVADSDEYEVGRHYAFTPTGPLPDPADDDE